MSPAALVAEGLATAWGWALVHSLWQGCLVGLLIAIAFRRLPALGTASRHTLASLGLSLLVVLPVATVALALSSATARGLQEISVPPTVAAAGAAGEGLGELHGTKDRRPSGALANWVRWTGVLWALGLCAFLGRLTSSWWASRRLRAGSHPASGRILEVTRELARRFGLAPPSVAVSPRIDGPAIVGVASPVLLLPGWTETELEEPALRAVLAHEICHIARRDSRARCLQEIARALLFFHPVAWWLTRRIEIERENCCDTLAVEGTGDRAAYVGGLLRLATLRAGLGDRSPALSVAWGDGSLLERTRRILNGAAENHRRGTAWMAAGALFVTVMTGAAAGGRWSPVSESWPGAIELMAAEAVVGLARAPLAAVLEAKLEGADPRIVAASAPEIEARRDALLLLGLRGGSQEVAPLATALDHPSANVRRRAALALGLTGEPSAHPHLARILTDDKDPAVRAKTVAAIGFLRHPDARRELAAARSDPDSEVRRKADHALGLLEILEPRGST